MTDLNAAPEVFHFARPDAWQRAQAAGVYQPDEFEREGFIHCATAAQVDGVIARHLRGGGPRIRLRIDTAALGQNLVYEWSAASNDLYPHIFGGLPLTAVRAAEPFNPDS